MSFFEIFDTHFLLFPEAVRLRHEMIVSRKIVHIPVLYISIFFFLKIIVFFITASALYIFGKLKLLEAFLKKKDLVAYKKTAVFPKSSACGFHIL